MFSKVIGFFVLIAVVSSAPQEPARYPAGVDPSLCPGFPICDNALLHGTAPVAPSHASHHGAWNNHGAWNYHHAAPAPAAHAYNHWNGPSYDFYDSNDIQGPGGDKYPAGVNPAACPNYPYCDTGASAHAPAHALPLHGYIARQYPAGVNAAACPNYPYCH